MATNSRNWSNVSNRISCFSFQGFDANKSLDLDFYVPPLKSSGEVEQTSSSISSNDSPIIPQPIARTSIPIKTIDLYPGSTTTTTINEDAKRIIDNLPNLSFMSAKALMFPIRFNANNDESSSSLYWSDWNCSMRNEKNWNSNTGKEIFSEKTSNTHLFIFCSVQLGEGYD